MSGGPRPERTVRTSVLVLNFNGRQHLDACLESLGAMDVFVPGEPGRPRAPGVADEVVLVDNGSTDGSVARARERFPWVRVIENGGNLGFALGYDAAVPFVGGEWIALLNSDTRVGADWLAELHRAAARHPGCGAVASRILSWDGARVDFVGADTFFTGHAWQRGLGEPAGGTDAPEREVLFGCAAALLVRRETFLRHGGFDPEYFAFFEDVDLGWRMTLAGDATWFAPEAIAYHKLHGSFGSRPQARVRFLCERNALATVFKAFGPERGGVFFLASAALTFLRGWASSSASRPESRPWLTTDALAHLLALADVARLAPNLGKRRTAAQAARRRSDAEIQPLFGDLAHPPTALGPEYREPLRVVVDTLGLVSEGFARVYEPDLDAAARDAALLLGTVCGEAVGHRYESGPFLRRGDDLDWEHPIDARPADSLRETASAVRRLLGSDLGPGAVDAFARSLRSLPGKSEGSARVPGGAPPADVPSQPDAPGTSLLSTSDDTGPLVTVVIRTKDRSGPLRAALASVAAQSYRRLEVVVVDDGEEDVAPILAGFSPGPPAVRLCRAGGIGRTRAAQRGLEAAAGEFVNFLDDDDELLPDHLEALVGTQRRTGARAVHSDVVLVALEDDGAGGFVAVETETLGGPLDPSRLLFESTLPLMSVLLDRELALEAGGFDPALDYFEDWDLFLRLSRTVTFAHCPRVTARYLVAPGQGHGSGMTGAHRWPHLATLFERHRERIRGADWARFYRAQVESVRLHARALEGQLRECAAQREEERAGVRALGDRVAQLEQQVITAERARRRVEEVLLSVERSRVFRVTQRVRRLLGRR